MYSDVTEIGDFFDVIWGKEEGFVYLPTVDRENNDWNKRCFVWPDKRETVIRYVQAESAKGFDVYFAPAIFTKPSPKKENVKGSRVLFADFDGNAPDDWTSESPEAGSVAHRAVPTPSLRVQSSSDGHEHVYWLLDEFNTDSDWIEGCNRSIAYDLKADSSGWDITQILRPPGTVNFKPGKELPVTIITSTDSHYAISDFESLKPVEQFVDESIDIDNLPNVENVIFKYMWDDEHRNMFMQKMPDEKFRSTALMRLGYFCCERGMSDAEAFAIIENADRRWGKFVGRQDRKRRLMEIINRARQKHPVGEEELDFRGTTSPDEIIINEQYIYGFQDFVNEEVKVSWLVEGLLESGGLGMVAAKPGVGKTQISIQLGTSCVLGTSFLGWSVPRPLRVMLLSLEMGKVALNMLMKIIDTGYTEDEQSILNEQFVVVALGEPIPLDKPRGFDFVSTLLSDIKPDVVIVDSFGKLVTRALDENTVRELNTAILRLRNKHDVAFWFVHHNRKSNAENKKPTDLDDVYGNQYITAEMSSVIVLYNGKPQDTTIEVIPVKARLARLRFPFKIIRDIDTLSFSTLSSGGPAIENIVKGSDGVDRADFDMG